jgi:hypothetical protein
MMREVKGCEEMIAHRLEHGRLNKTDLEELLALIEWLEEMRGFIRSQAMPAPSSRRRMALSIAAFGRQHR